MLDQMQDDENEDGRPEGNLSHQVCDEEDKREEDKN